MTEEIQISKKFFSKLGWMYVLGTLIIYAVQMIPLVFIQLARPQWLENPDISLLVSVLPMYLVGMPLLIFLVKRIPAERIERHRMKAGQFAVAAVICFGLVYLTNVVGNLLTVLIGYIKGGTVENLIVDVATSVSIWFVLIYMVLIAPFMEEYVFRKLIVDRTVRYGQATAVVLSGLMFGLFHGNLNQFVYAFALGAFLAYLYVKTGNLKITIALHMMINFMGGVVSVLLLDLVDLEALQTALTSGDISAVINCVAANLPGWLVYGIYVVFVYGTMIAGGVLLIVFLAKSRLTFAPGTVALQKGKRFQTVICNPGMIVYCTFWIAMIVYQLFA